MIEGHCHERFAPVREAFAANLATDPPEIGAAVCVVVDGTVVVDLWGGWADVARTRPWTADTLCNAYSVGKAIVATQLLQLVDRGLVGLDDPIADHWPGFVAPATVRQALCHRAGVPAIRDPMTNDDLWDFDRMAEAVAATEPWWVPGERHAYHTNTYGHLVGGLVRKVDGRLPGDALRDLGLDVHVGLPADQHDRCAEVAWDGPTFTMPDTATLTDEQRMTMLGYVNPPGYASIDVVNTPQWRAAQVPSTNGQMSARGIAGFYRALLDGELLSPGVLAEATRLQSSGWCPTLGQDVTFGLGFQPWTEHRPLGRTPGSYGHFGTGGSLGFADPTHRIAFGYVMNHVIPRWQSPRNRALADAVYASL